MQLAELFSVSSEWLLHNVTSISLGIIILFAGWFGSSYAANKIANTLHKSRFVDKTIVPLITQLARYGILTISIIIALTQFGVATTSILTVVGAAGLAIALALQGTLSNIAAGIMLVALRPMSLGDFIEGNGASGTVVEIGLFATRLRTADGIYLFVPNSQIWNTNITNYSREPRRRVDIRVGIGYDSDIKLARQTLETMALADQRVLSDPKATVYVETLGDSSVGMLLRCWVSTPDYWDVLFSFTEQTKLELDKVDIEIPYNKLDVNLTNVQSED